MVVILIIIAYGIIGFFEIAPLVKQKQKKELIIYLATFTFAFVISILLGLGVKIPSPAKPIESAVKAVLDVFTSK
jgi:MFS superfamily sulfate permease-like transporter